MPLRIMDVHRDLQEHKEKDSEFHETVHGMFAVIKDNHLSHIQSSMAKIETNVDWLMKFFWVVVPVLIGMLVKLIFFK